MTKEQREKLLYQPKNGYDRLTKDEEAELNAYCEAYKAFLDRSKTERECVFTAIREAEARGFVEYKPGMPIQTGDKFYWNNRGKGHHAGGHRRGRFVPRREHRRGAHRRSRLDIKPNPSMRTPSLPTSRRTITVASASTSG